MIVGILQVCQVCTAVPRMPHVNESPTPGNFGRCCTFYFCAGVTCRLVPGRRVGVQLHPAAHCQQKQRLRLAIHTHTERLRFTPILPFLRDSRWGIYAPVTSSLPAAVPCFAALIFTRRGLPNSPCFLQRCSSSALSCLPVSEMLLFCNRAQL